MNELQKKEFELLKVFTEVCAALQMDYFLVCGTALGAAKYKGFIPWDDDVDVALRREDYERFVKEAHKHLPAELFLQNYKSDPAFPNIFSKLRNSETAYIEKSVAHLDMNHGIYIDIFPLDGYPSDEKAAKSLERAKRRFVLMQSCMFGGEKSLKARFLERVLKLFGVHKRFSKEIERFEKRISAYSTDASELWCNHGNWQGKLEYAKKEQYGRGVSSEFEGLQVRIPEMIDEYLTQKYGKWRDDLPEEEKKGHHLYEYMDTERSYREYLKNEVRA